MWRYENLSAKDSSNSYPHLARRNAAAFGDSQALAARMASLRLREGRQLLEDLLKGRIDRHERGFGCVSLSQMRKLVLAL